MEISVDEAIKELNEDILEKQKQIELIKNINWDKPVNENEWHKICETSLRNSDLLGVLVKNIFPEATNINVHCNYVYFRLHGIKCAIPTSRCRGIYIDTSWYEKDFGEPNYHGTIKEYEMQEYFKAKDNGENWLTLFNKKCPELKYYRTWAKFFLWFGYYTFEDDKREIWEEKFKQNQAELDIMIEEYNEERKAMYELTKTMVEVIIPELKKFSMNIYTLNSNNWTNPTPEEIAKTEGIEFI